MEPVVQDITINVGSGMNAHEYGRLVFEEAGKSHVFPLTMEKTIIGR